MYLAQLVERQAFNLNVHGSSPSPANLFLLFTYILYFAHHKLYFLPGNEKMFQLVMSDMGDSEYNRKDKRGESEYKYLLSPLDCSALTGIS
jgi:hypothetical protein